MKKVLLPLAFVLLLASCNKYDLQGMFFGSSPDSNSRFTQSMEYNDRYGYRSIEVDTDEYTVYLCSDAHISESAEGLERFVVDCLSDVKTAPFALFLGDAVGVKDRFGRFFETVAPFDLAGRTLFCTPGNHDLYYGQWSEWVDAFKTSSYLFTVETPTQGKDLFICLDSGSGTLGTLQRDRLEKTLSASKGLYRNIIVFTHTHFFRMDSSQGHTSNYNLEECLDLAKLFADYGVGLVLCGHDHEYEETFFKNVRYISVACIEDGEDNQSYYILEVKRASQGSDGNAGSHLKLNPIPIAGQSK